MESIAAFGQATFHVSDKLALTGGLRYTDDRVDTEGTIFSFSAPILALTPGSIPKTTVEANGLSWRASLQYSPTANLMAYTTFAGGYKGPGFNDFSTTPVRPETSHLEEVGLKSMFFDKRLMLDISLFNEKFDAFQAQTFISTPPFFETLNAGSLTSRGFEVEARALIGDGLTIQANVSYADAWFSSFLGDQCYAGEPAGTSPSPNVCFDNHSNSTGNSLPNSPRWSGTASANYTHRLTDRLNWNAGVSVYSRTRINFSSNADPNRVQGGYSLLGATVGVESSDHLWNISLFCKNCLDERFVGFIAPFPLGPTNYQQAFLPDSFRTLGSQRRTGSRKAVGTLAIFQVIGDES